MPGTGLLWVRKEGIRDLQSDYEMQIYGYVCSPLSLTQVGDGPGTGLVMGYIIAEIMSLLLLVESGC